jgi:hypothetical protein
VRGGSDGGAGDNQIDSRKNWARGLGKFALTCFDGQCYIDRFEFSRQARVAAKVKGFTRS